MCLEMNKSKIIVFLKWSIVSAILIIVTAAFVLFKPINKLSYQTNILPISDYQTALNQFKKLNPVDPSKINPDCESKLLDHGKKVEKVIVFFHGYTTCPKQFLDLAEQFYTLGYNVLIPREPYHGYKDRLTSDIALLTSEDLAKTADDYTNLAHGLGNKVIAAGISGGGTTVAWIAENRNDVDLAVLISPAFNLKAIPSNFIIPAVNYYSITPNSFTWWDEQKQEQADPPHAYPRYATKSLAQIVRLGYLTTKHSKNNKPLAKAILVVTNANDGAVDNKVTDTVKSNWEKLGYKVSAYEFPKALNLGHDLIDPIQPDARTDIVYPKLIDLITEY